jgi:hypothetical protein
MGSFLKSCSLTNQTIQENSEVIIIPFGSHLEKLPAPIILNAVAKDYGIYDIIESDIEYKVFKDFILKHCYMKDSSDIIEINSNITSEELFRHIENEEIFVNLQYKNEFVLKLFVCEKVYFDLILKEYSTYNFRYPVKDDFNDILSILQEDEMFINIKLYQFLNSEISYFGSISNYLQDKHISLVYRKTIFDNYVKCNKLFLTMRLMNLPINESKYVGQDYCNSYGLRYLKFIDEVSKINDQKLIDDPYFDEYNNNLDLEDYKEYKIKNDY